MGTRRPWKLYFHHDGTKVFSNDEATLDAYVIDTSRPIDGKSSHTRRDDAESAARQVSRNGGSARIMLRDNSTGAEQEVRTYAPYEAAMDELLTAT